MKYLLLSLCVTIVLAIAPIANAQHVQWANNGIGMGKTNTSNYFLNDNATQSSGYVFKNMNITNDGGGGVIMCWMGVFGSYYQVFAQRLDCQGNQVWTSSVGGLQLTNGIGEFPTAVGDGAGGAYISYTVYNAGTGYDMQYVQHVLSNGLSAWASGVGD